MTVTKFIHLLGCMLAGQSCFVSDTSAVAVYSHLLFLPHTFLWPIGATVSRLWEHVVNPGWLQLAMGHGSWCPCPALVSPCGYVGRQTKVKAFKIKVYILWKEADVQTPQWIDSWTWSDRQFAEEGNCVDGLGRDKQMDGQQMQVDGFKRHFLCINWHFLIYNLIKS